MVENFFEAQANMMKQFQEMYSKGENANAYTENIEKIIEMQKGMMETAAEVNPFMTDDLKKIQEDYFKSLSKMPDFFTKPYSMDMMGELYKENPMNFAFDQFKKQFDQIDMRKFIDPDMQRVLERMFISNEFYLNMYEMYKEFNERLVDTVDFHRLGQVINQNTEMAYQAFVASLPEEMRIYFAGPKDLVNLYFDVAGKFYTPWLEDIDKFQDLIIEGALENDSSKLTAALNMWKKNYEKTFGKIVSAPSVGSDLNTIELQNKVFEELVDAIVISSEFMTNIMSIQKKAAEEMVDRYIKLVEEGKEAKTFDEFYRFWATNMDDALISYFGSEEFASLLGQFGKEFMELKVAVNKLAEEFFRDTPVVTEGKMDSIIKTVYELKKEVRDLKDKIEELELENKENIEE